MLQTRLEGIVGAVTAVGRASKALSVLWKWIEGL